MPLLVRINAADSPAWTHDLAAIDSLPGLSAVMVPKAESAESLAALHHSLPGVPIVPLVESVAGFYAVKTLAMAPGVLRLAVGHIDFMADAGMTCDEQESELDSLAIRSRNGFRAAGLAPAIDGVTVETDNEEPAAGR